MNQTALTIRKATTKDINHIMDIYDHARNYMTNNGNPSQWGSNYPSKALICDDIANGISYVFCNATGDIQGVYALIIGDDPTYKNIEGQWLNTLPYGTIHRIASNGKHKGLLKSAVDYSLTLIDNLRIDTHEANLKMQYLIKNLGFTYCGIIYVEDGSPRLAYHKSLSK